MRDLLFSLFVFSIISCQKEKAQTTVAGETKLNVSYGSQPAQKMDIYLPEGRSATSTKVLILVHGGGWSTGDKSDFNNYIDTLKKRMPSYAIINVNYQLASSGSNLFPTQELDVKAAVEFIYSKKNEYNISDKFVMLGASAGAHLSLLYSYKYSSPVKIKAVVDLFGPTDLVDMYNNPASLFAPPAALAAVVGGTPATRPALYAQSSPITFVNAQVPPTIILQGGVDPLVSVNQSLSLKNLLATAGVTTQYVFYPTEGHGWTGSNMVDSFDKIALFLNTVLP